LTDFKECIKINKPQERGWDLERADLKSIIDQSPEAEVLVRGIFYKLQEKSDRKLFKKFAEANQCEKEIQKLLHDLQTSHCPNVPIVELRNAVWSLCLLLLHREFTKNK
jgi:hypothetical protein